MKKVFIFTIFFLMFCKKTHIPAGIPLEAKYDKKRNVYSLQVANSLKTWRSSGSLYSECVVNQYGQMNGECRYFSDKGILISSGKFREGQRDGLWVWNFLDGKLYYKQEFAFGKRTEFWIQVIEWGNEHGVYERYYQNGQLEEKGSFDSGKRHGSWQKFFINGKMEYSGNYSAGKKVGDWKYYFPDGKLEAVEKFTKAGDLVQRTSFFTNGKTRCEQSPGKVICNG